MMLYRRAPYLITELKGRDFVLINCDNLRRHRVDVRLLALLAALHDWLPLSDIRAEFDVELADLERLVRMGVVQERDEAQTAEGDPVFWDPIELAVHRQSNIGGYREEDVRSRGLPPPALFKELPDVPRTKLGAPSALPLMSLEKALSKRRSMREFAAGPLELERLSSLLYHCLRIIRVEHSRLLGDHAFRPFPSGGARGELEAYVIANDVSGLPSGAHYYDALRHELVFIRERDGEQERINRGLREATDRSINREPPAVLVITAVFSRVMWKYRGIGLGVIYKNVGCLYQTIYLVATALGLAPCGIGGGEEWRNSRWLGLDPLLESQVGCVLVGASGGAVELP